MGIPNIEIFNDFLSSLTHIQPLESNDFESFEVVQSRVLTEGTRPFSTEPDLLWYKKACRLKITSVLEKISKELQLKGHPSSENMSRILLGLYYLFKGGVQSPAERLNTILESVTKANSSQFWIYPYPPYPGTKPFRLGRFNIGPLNRRRLLSRCEKVQCDFFDRYPNRFSGRHAIEGDPIEVQLLDFPPLIKSIDSTVAPFGPNLLDYYFETLSDRVRENFIYEFQLAQEVIATAGAPMITLDSPQTSFGGSFICIYQMIGNSRTGYFCPLEMSAKVDFASADVRIPEKIKELEERFSFTGLQDFEIHKTLETFCRFVSRAKRYEAHSRWDESFLHYVIALDLLLGEKDASTQKISKRTALVVFHVLGETFDSATIRMKTIYERRSRYVHAGVSVTPQDLDVLRPIINEVFLALLRLQAVPENRRPGFIGDWLKNLDFLIAAIEARKNIEDADLLAVGISLLRG